MGRRRTMLQSNPREGYPFTGGAVGAEAGLAARGEGVECVEDGGGNEVGEGRGTHCCCLERRGRTHGGQLLKTRWGYCRYICTVNIL